MPYRSKSMRNGGTSVSPTSSPRSEVVNSDDKMQTPATNSRGRGRRRRNSSTLKKLENMEDSHRTSPATPVANLLSVVKSLDSFFASQNLSSTPSPVSLISYAEDSNQELTQEDYEALLKDEEYAHISKTSTGVVWEFGTSEFKARYGIWDPPMNRRVEVLSGRYYWRVNRVKEPTRPLKRPLKSSWESLAVEEVLNNEPKVWDLVTVVELDEGGREGKELT